MKTKTNSNRSRITHLTGAFSLPSAALALGMMIGSARDAAAQTYNLVPVNPPAGSVQSGGRAINNHGVVVGGNRVMSGKNEVVGPGFVWTAGTAISLPSLPPPYGTSAVPNDISDTGLIVGDIVVVNGILAPRAVWWQATSGGGFANGDWNALLPAGSPLLLTAAWAVSDDGQFVAFKGSNTSTGAKGAVLGRLGPEGLTVWMIPTIGNPPANLSDSTPYGIHFDGTTVRMTGSCKPEGSSQLVAFRAELDVTNGSSTIIALDSRASSGRSINGFGTAVGNTESSRASVWNADGTTLQLPTLGGATNLALAINDGGYVVGYSAMGGRNSRDHAFLWHPASGMRDLNSLKSRSDTSGIELMSASQINASGQILARGVIKNRYQDVVMTPAP